MTIKHSIPKTAEVTHIDGQLWGDIEWAIELLYNSVRTGSQLVWRIDPLVTSVVEKASRNLGPRASGWASGERERHNADGHKSRGQYITVLFFLQLPLTVKIWVTLFEPFQKNREVYFSKNCVTRLYGVVMFLHAHVHVLLHMATQQDKLLMGYLKPKFESFQSVCWQIKFN